MAGLFKNILGSGTKDESLSAELQAILSEIQNERKVFEASIERAEQAVGRFDELAQPIADAERIVRKLAEQIGALEKQVPEIRWAKDEAEAISKRHKEMQDQISASSSDSNRVKSQLAEISKKLDSALHLKEDMDEFLTLESPFKALRAEADELKKQLNDIGESSGEIRKKHEESVRDQNQAASRLEAATSSFQEAHNRVESIEGQVEELRKLMEDVAQVKMTTRDNERQLNTLKTLGSYVAQKISAIEGQRETVDRAASQAQKVMDMMKQIEQASKEHKENIDRLSEHQSSIDELKALHSEVLGWSDQIASQQQEIAREEQVTRSSLTAMRDEMKNSINYFKTELQGVNSVSQRIVELRNALNEFDGRFNSMDESTKILNQVNAKADGLSKQVAVVAEDVGRVEKQTEKLQRVGREVDRLDQVTQEIRNRMAQIEEAQPAIESALKDFGKLGESHEALKDALERVQITRGEIEHIREENVNVEAWLKNVQGLVDNVRGKVRDVNAAKGTVELLQKEVDRVTASIGSIESRRDFVEEIHNRLSEVASQGTHLEERTKGLLSRMDVADGRFLALSKHAEQAKRIEKSVTAVVTTVEDAEKRVSDIDGTIKSLEERSIDLTKLSDQTRQLGVELEQRQGALEQATTHLEQASKLRQEAAGLLHNLKEQTAKLNTSMASTEKRAERVAKTSEQLTERSNDLRLAEKRMSQFEAQVSKWEMAELQLRDTLEKVTARQATIEALQSDIKHMFEVAERTVEHIRAIESAHQQVAEGRAALDAVLEQMKSVDATVGVLNDRKQQIEEAEKRLSRAEAMLRDIHSTFEALQAQKAFADQLLETAGSLTFQSKQAEALIETLRKERRVTDKVLAAVDTMRQLKGSGAPVGTS
jgi:DNA repair exonuclease SbcCD ATPase subunit